MIPTQALNNKNGSRIGFHIITFGCQMNVNDSLWLTKALAAQGYVEAPLADAALVCINTCSVREKPERKVKATVARIRSENTNPDLCIAILGCVAKQEGEACFHYEPCVRVVCSPDQIIQLPALLAQALLHPSEHYAALADTPDFRERPQHPKTFVPPVAYVNIMQGCDNFCTYCIVPFTRGRQRSRDPLAIYEECRHAIAQGASEIMLLGQNVNAYGLDAATKHHRTFADLVADIAHLPGLLRLRYTSPHPKDMTERDIRAFAELATLCPSLHLPMQSGSNSVLRRMNRGYDQKRYLSLVAALYAANPSIALSTDIIVGFPGETDADLAETLRVMEEARFCASYSFCYSDRKGTRASNYPDKIPPSVQHERLLAVQELQERLTEQYLTSRVGSQTTVLLERASKRGSGQRFEGRDPFGVRVHLLFDDTNDHTGEYHHVVITEKGKHCLFGTRLGIVPVSSRAPLLADHE